LFEKAVDQGYAPAQLNLGYMYSYSEGVKEDEPMPFAGLPKRKTK
jgi:TPR repeat protein